MFIDILTSELWFSCVFLNTFEFLFAVVSLCAVLGTFFGCLYGFPGALWGVLGGLRWSPRRSLECLGVSLAALGGHFALMLLDLASLGDLGPPCWVHFALLDGLGWPLC